MRQRTSGAHIGKKSALTLSTQQQQHIERQACTLLLKARADPLLSDGSGQSALSMAAAPGYAQMFSGLIEAIQVSVPQRASKRSCSAQHA